MSDQAIIRTVRGDIAPADLGKCYGHEHVIGHPPPHKPDDTLVLDSESAAIEELTAFKQVGGQALVEMSTPDFGRDADALARIAAAADVHIIAATGYNKEPFCKPWIEDATVDDLVARYVADVTQGMDGTSARAGVIKASSTLNTISPLAEKLFLAAAAAHHATGAPISTHTEAGTMAVEQVEMLTAQGVDPAHIIIGHIDRRLEWDAVLALAQTGVFFGIDQISKEKYYADSQRIYTILRLVEEGYGGQILLSGDMARRSYWPSYGPMDGTAYYGPGLTFILRRFAPWLREMGASDAAIDDLLIHNPARALAFVPVG
jgi:predicted metal-dependent phosphotriesterase family hydrolase